MKTSTFSNESVLLSHENYDISALYETEVKPAPAAPESQSQVRSASHAPLPTHRVIVTFDLEDIEQSVACKTTKAAWEFIKQDNSGADFYSVYGPNGIMTYCKIDGDFSILMEHNEMTYAYYRELTEEFRYLDSHKMVIEYETNEGSQYTIKYGMAAAMRFVAGKGECFINTPAGYYCYGFESVSQYQLFTYDHDMHDYDQLVKFAA